MKEKRIRLSIYIFIGGLVYIIVSFLVMLVYCSVENNRLRTYEFTEENLEIPQDDLVIQVTPSKHWKDLALHSKVPVGGQYDGVITNDSRQTLQKWQVVMTFSDDCIIDSSWNGDFTAENNVVTFTAKDETSVVEPKNSATFGAVLYSNSVMNLTGYTISGYRIIHIFQLPYFWVLVSFSASWLLIGVTNTIVAVKTKKFKARQELDTVIIQQSISTFTGFIDAKDTYTKGHSSRVAEYSAEIARRMKMNADEVGRIYQIGLMHDCGKIGIPDLVLKKPGALTREEYKIIKSHTTLGDGLLYNFTAIPGIRDGAHYHHERYDGKGYPNGLAGEEIPLCARIICVADSFDAMSSNRCYRKQLTTEKIISELTENEGKQFDPNLVAYMLEMMRDGFVAGIREKYQAE